MTAEPGRPIFYRRKRGATYRKAQRFLFAAGPERRGFFGGNKKRFCIIYFLCAGRNAARKAAKSHMEDENADDNGCEQC